MRRACLLIAVVATLLAAPAAWASRSAIVPAGPSGAPLLTTWWSGPLGKSADDPANPFVNGGCPKAGRHLVLDYHGQCTVKAGTWIFEVGFTTECSNLDPAPFHVETPLAAARCGLRTDRLLTEVTLSMDGGRPLSLLDGRFGTFMLPGRVVVPENPVAPGAPGQIMRFGGHGYVALIRPLPVGEHTLHGHVEGAIDGLPAEGIDFDTALTVTR